jgi:hypothetical protein
MLARGQEARALHDAERALELARHGSDAQLVVGVACVHAAVMVGLGRLELARDDWAALMAFGDDVGNTLSQGYMPLFAWLAVDLDTRPAALAVVDHCESPDWALVGRSILTGEPAIAAEVLDRMGEQSEAAYARLRSGGEQVRSALQFYETVGATRFARQALAALETSA